MNDNDTAKEGTEHEAVLQQSTHIFQTYSLRICIPVWPSCYLLHIYKQSFVV